MVRCAKYQSHSPKTIGRRYRPTANNPAALDVARHTAQPEWRPLNQVRKRSFKGYPSDLQYLPWVGGGRWFCTYYLLVLRTPPLRNEIRGGHSHPWRYMPGHMHEPRFVFEAPRHSSVSNSEADSWNVPVDKRGEPGPAAGQDLCR